MMRPDRIIIPTADGSHTISIPELNVTYHSHHGAVQESLHVFIEAGLRYWWQQHPEGAVRILEMGLGTGLNALLTLSETKKVKRGICYTALELYPLQRTEWEGLQFGQEEERYLLQKIHEANWGKNIKLTPYFTLCKEPEALQSFTTDKQFDLIYYDAFAPGAQPELWTEAIFRKLFSLMNDGAVLVTYCAKGDVRRAMIAAGLEVQRIPGPKGKREILRAKKDLMI